MKKLGFVFITIILLYITIGVIDSILLNVSTKTNFNCKKKEYHEYMLLEPSSIYVDSNKIYIFCNRFSKMNVYQKKQVIFYVVILFLIQKQEQVTFMELAKIFV